MNVADPISLLFGAMEKLGPGTNEQTLQVLRLLPQQRFDLVVDAGCGTGRQTIALARERGTLIHAGMCSTCFSAPERTVLEAGTKECRSPR